MAKEEKDWETVWWCRYVSRAALFLLCKGDLISFGKLFLPNVLVGEVVVGRGSLIEQSKTGNN